jgi:uncharacterized protein (TIGR03118 family)
MKKYSPAVCTLTLLAAAQFSFASSFTQTNLVSDLSTEGAVTVDPSLKNPWGMSFSSTSPFWISNEVGNTSTLYSGAGVQTATVKVSVPGGPTGQVNNSAGAGNFVVNGSASSFIFDTLSGTIAAWNGSLGAMGTAATLVSTPGAVYTGLALGNNGSANYLYAANFAAGGGINVFNNAFTSVSATTFAGKFIDPNLPAGYAPFNIQLIGNSLYVEYAEVSATPGGAARGAGLGYVDVFDLDGNLVQRLVGSGSLNAPWGVTLAPAGFGQFGGDLLVGNFGDGTINAFDPSTGSFLGTLDDANGNPIVNSNLWAIDFRPDGGDNSNPDALYFDAGINRQADGLFGEITPTPEPSVYGTAGLGLGLLCGFMVRGRRKRQPNF